MSKTCTTWANFARTTAAALAVACGLASAAMADTLPTQINLGLPPAEQATSLWHIYNIAGATEAPAAIVYGDFNYDNYDDIALGYPDRNGGAGEVVILMEPPFGYVNAVARLSNVVTYRIPCAAAGAHFGAALAASDVDGDGVEDLVIGAPDYDGGKGFVTVWSGYFLLAGGGVEPAINPAAAAPANCTFFIGADADSHYGFAVGAGDTTADGKCEVAVSQPQYGTIAKPNTGRVIMYFGTTFAFGQTIQQNGPAQRLLITGGTNQQAGYAIAFGDVNGDGYDEMTFSVPYFQPNYGIVAGFISPGLGFASYQLDAIGVTSWFVVTGAESYGTSLAIGDFDGDGVDDILGGAPYQDVDTLVDAGHALLFPGRTSLSNDYYFIYSSNPGDYQDVRFYGSEANMRLGTSVALGDIDGDGGDDIILGAPGASAFDGTAGDYGQVLAVYNANIQTAIVDFATVEPDLRLFGENFASGMFGAHIAADGDFDGDGFADLAALAPGAAHPTAPADAGALYILQGNSDITDLETFESHQSGSTAWTAVGGSRMAATSRVRVSYNGGSSGTTEAYLFRDKTLITNLGIGTGQDIAKEFWRVETNRSGWSQFLITLDYTPDQIKGFPEDRIEVYWSENLEGPWALVADVNQSPFPNRLIFSAPVAKAYYAILSNAPIITLNGEPEITLECGEEWVDPGATAFSTVDGDITANVFPGNSVNAHQPGVYSPYYGVQDSTGATVYATRTVTVVDTLAPQINLEGEADVSVECGASIPPLAFTATDQCDGDISAQVVVTGNAPAASPGVYVQTLNVTDGEGLAATPVTRTVTVVDNTAPVITLNGSAAVTINCGSTYTEAGATATDACDGSLTGQISITGDTVVTGTVGVYVLLYNVSDSEGNPAPTKTRVVTVSGPCGGEGEGEGEGETGIHSADQNSDSQISLSELLRIVQFFNTGGYRCAASPGATEDGYLPGTSGGQACTPHSSDYNPQDWTIILSELLRLIQFFNSGGYHACQGSEDGYCPGL